MNYKYSLLALFATMTIIYMSSIPESSTPGSGLFAEIIWNLLHIPAYFLITILWLKAFRTKESLRWPSNMQLLILVGLILFAFSDEIHQSFVPGRTASLMDIGLDILGIFLGLVVFKNLTMFSGILQEK